MRFTDYVGRALTLWGSDSPFIGQQEVQTWCIECGATHRRKTPRPGELEQDTMFHQPWCSVDMRNIRRTVGVTRR